jgi:predicted Zn-dependent protease
MRKILLILFINFINFTCNGQFLFSKTQNKNIVLKGLNSYTQKDLSIIKSIIEKYTTFKVQYQEPLNNKKLEVRTGRKNLIYIDCDDVQKLLGNRTYSSYDMEIPITIYVTRINIKLDRRSLNGLCYGNEIYLQINPDSKELTTKSLLHEMLHSFGVEHCTNNCIMGYYKIHEVWENKYRVCSDCRRNMPEYFKL